MGTLRLQVLSQAEIEKVHERSLDVLAKAGVTVQDEECRQALRKAGASVDEASGCVRLPRELVQDALSRTPASYTLHRIDGKTVEVGGDKRVYGSLVTDPWIIDYATQRPRRPVLDDFVRHTRLGDALPVVDMIHRMDMPPADVAPEIAYVRSLEVYATNTTKHLVSLPSSDESTRDWLEVAEILAGGHSLRERPIMSLGVAVTSPLQFTQINANVLKAAVGNGLPVLMVDCVMAGTTSPLSFAGSLLMSIAENLFLITLTQVIAPGNAFIFGAGQSLTDLRTGFDVYYNADKMLWKTATIQMGKFYNLPITGETGGSLVGRYDIQAGMEQALLMLPSIVCGQNLMNGLGSCYNAVGMSPELMVMQADLVELLERVAAGMDTSEDMLSADAITDIGPGGHFLEDPLTIRMLRSGEFYSGGSFDRLAEHSPNDPQHAMLVRAHERMEKLLATHVPAVSADTVEQIGKWARSKEAARP